MANTLTPGGSVFVVATRVTPLSANGSVAAGTNSYTTDKVTKATITPATESGDEVTVKTGAGEIGVYAKHGDIVKRYTVSLELAVPDPQLEQALVGGVVLNDTTTGLSTPTGSFTPAVNSGITGTLSSATYGYRWAQYNEYGDSTAMSEVTVAVTGPAAVVIPIPTLAAGAFGATLYGRSPGAEQLLGRIVNIGSQATSASSGTGTVTSLTVTALTKPIPSGYTFTIAGDTNSPKIVFTTTQAAGAGATALNVTASGSITTTIAAGAIQPVFVDTGALTPSGAMNTTDMSAGPGNAVGMQAPATLSVPSSVSLGVSLEFWSKRYVNGVQASDYPYWRYVLPQAINFVLGARDITNGIFTTLATGEAYPNPNWGSGPFSDWPYDSTKVYQRAMCGAAILPTPSVVPVPAFA